MDSIEDAYRRLHSAGWSVGETSFVGPEGKVWVVVATRGQVTVRGEGRTLVTAWWDAARQAEGVGPASRNGPVDSHHQ